LEKEPSEPFGKVGGPRTRQFLQDLLVDSEMSEDRQGNLALAPMSGFGKLAENRPKNVPEAVANFEERLIGAILLFLKPFDAMDQIQRKGVVFEVPNHLSVEAEKLGRGVVKAHQAVLDSFAELVEAIEREGLIEVVFILEMKIDRPLGDARLRRDVVHADFVVMPFGE
jgi:hypothetical protein